MDVVVENISKSFGTQKAVNDVSFKVRRGEILGILGPNGAGKTTIMKIITCFLFPDRGNVFIGNQSIYRNPAKIKKHIGYLAENNPLYEDMNVIDFLKFIAEIHEIPRYKRPARIMDMIRICGLESEKHKNIRELSKGYKQRLGLAQTLIHEPDVIILDEPTTGLDPNQIFDIRELIKNTGKERTIIMSSHILAEIEATCDRVLILNKGEIVANGTSAELRKDTSIKILNLKIEGGEPEEIYKELAHIEEIKSLDISENSFTIKAYVNENVEKSIFAICNAHNWYIKQLTPVEKGLEDIFRLLTQEK